MASSNFSDFMCKEIVFGSKNILTPKVIKTAISAATCDCGKQASSSKTKSAAVIKTVSAKKSSAL